MASLPAHGSWNQPHLVRLNSLTILLIFFASANGYDSSLMNSLQALPQWNSFMSNPQGTWLGFINAIYFFGILSAYPFSPVISQRFGRKCGNYVGYLFLVAGTIVQTSAQNQASFLVARYLTGVSCGFWTTTAPLLISEISYPAHRAILSTLFMCGYYLGAVMSAWATFGTRSLESSWSWRIPSILQLVCPTISCISLIFCPQSPRWLIHVGRNEEARQMIAKHHAGGAIDDPLVVEEMELMETALQLETEASQTTWVRDMVSTAGNRHRLLISISLAVFTQWCGSGVVSYYLTMILNTVGVTSTTDQLIISGSLQIWNFLLAFVSACVVERIGRRGLFQLSAGIMLVSFAVITGLTAGFEKSQNTPVGVAVVPFLFLFFGGYDIALTPLITAYPCEIWPFTLRARGLTLTWTVNVAANCFNVFVSPIAMDAISWKYYLVFIVMLCVYNITVYFFYVETRGCTLEGIALIFDGESDDGPVIVGKDPNSADHVSSLEKGVST